MLDDTIDELRPNLNEDLGGFQLPISSLLSLFSGEHLDLKDLKIFGQASWQQYQVIQRESGTIWVRESVEYLRSEKAKLKEVARGLGVDLINFLGNAKNTRSSGADIIKVIDEAKIIAPVI